MADRSALSEARRGDQPSGEPVDPLLLGRFIDAFERYDIDSIVTLLHHDVVVSMPPYAFWLRGREMSGRWLRCTENGGGGVWKPVGLHAPTWRDGKISALHAFLDPAIFTLFDLPATVPALDEDRHS